jgi:hypothetical protein
MGPDKPSDDSTYFGDTSQLRPHRKTLAITWPQIATKAKSHYSEAAQVHGIVIRQDRHSTYQQY